jgi:hypothetical protein
MIFWKPSAALPAEFFILQKPFANLPVSIDNKDSDFYYKGVGNFESLQDS